MFDPRYTKEFMVAKLQAPLQAQRRRRREYFQRITPKVTAAQTRPMIELELAILWAVDDAPGGVAKMWPTMTRLAKVFSHSTDIRKVHAERRLLLAVVERLRKGEMVARFRCRRWNGRANDLLLSELGSRRLHQLRGTAPVPWWDARARPSDGPSLDDFLQSPETFLVDEHGYYRHLVAPPGTAATTAAAPPPGPPPSPPPEVINPSWGGQGMARRGQVYVV
jgi:hypothetical protein